MNTPNKLTLLRIILVPFFVAVLLLDFPHHFLVAGLVFGLAAITDCIDGKLARKNNQITDFGKFADPLADKILVISAFVCFVQMGIIGAIPVIVVLFREFAVTSIRLLAASSGKVVAANIWGKLKTVSQIVAVVAIIVFHYGLELITMGVIPAGNEILAFLQNIVYIIDNVLVWVTVVFTLISGIIYIKQNKEFLNAK